MARTATTKTPPATRTPLARRLDQAIKDSRLRSVRAFAAAMQERGLSGKGAARSMIHRYLNGDASPPLEWITAAAEELGVSRTWLAFGEGEADAARTEAVESATHVDLGEYAWVTPYMAETAVGVLFEDVVYAYHRTGAVIDEGEPSLDVSEHAQHIAGMLVEPILAWQYPALDQRRFVEYATAMLHALMLVIPTPDEAEEIRRAMKRTDKPAVKKTKRTQRRS